MDDPGNAPTSFAVVHSLWSTFLTGFGALIVWNGRRLIGQVDKKADQEDLAAHREDTKERFKAMQDTINESIKNQASQHQENSRRLDTILLAIHGRRSDR